jgi:uncharacterized protein (TIGR03086 family)
MTSAPPGLGGAVELLDRSLAWTRVALAETAHVPGTTPTPCRGWPLQRLLAHMEDGLDAYAEAATGSVSLRPDPAAAHAGGRAPREPLRGAIRDKACALLGWWLEHPDLDAVRVGDRWLPSEVLVGAAALEITLHGWDLRAAAGHVAPVPRDLAAPLLDVVRDQVSATAMPCVGTPLAVPDDADSPRRLLALLGRPT